VPIWRDGEAKLRVGISSCLLGQAVRFDGGHKRERWLTDVLAPYVEWVPVCPEVELGMGVPRETVQLVREAGAVRMLGTRSRRDWSDAMRRFAERRTRALRRLELCGYVLKKDSPSCGMERVAVQGARGLVRRDGRGLFAEALLAADPLLPVEEEGRLADAALRESWLERVFAYRRLRSLSAGRFSLGRLVAFHTAHKLQLLAHSEPAYRALGRLVAGAKKFPRAELRRCYGEGFMRALAVRATRRRHVYVLQHCRGHFRARLDAGARAALAAEIADYRRGIAPLSLPTTTIRHHAERLGVSYLAGQAYLEPHPTELSGDVRQEVKKSGSSRT
jgi:uncharacterized protein YbgA (DUF1722 family)/uncharacterized protein YbbK (DUF523 family)